ncbi:hypothetical protein EZV73_25365 [Acidaminobacter sp. JC074]|uniref:hypothetical protein n=1 Tax=Acidaminobacter sp. JC074 TaxID=2530199 RepID=UPI001F1054E6|nr:hypothetical protein [Acidaminobacter sp. JC074]MCH4890935.1 hypothetical protein [Acidaminobacter sp. JC074]
MNVVKATIEDLDKAVDLAYDMQRHVNTRCRPLLADVSRHDLYERFKRYIRSDEHDILLVEKGGKLEGFSPVNVIEEDFYIAYTQGPYGYDYDAVSECLYNYLKENYPGYKLYVNTAKEHRLSIDFYENKGFRLEEEAQMLKLETCPYSYSDDHIEEINTCNRNLIFDWIEKHVDEDTYWNSNRISDNLERFIILGYFNEGIRGHIIGRGSNDYTEVIAFSGNPKVKEELLKVFISKAYEKNVNLIDLYSEDEFEASLGIKYGFDLYDNNLCYIKYF